MVKYINKTGKDDTQEKHSLFKQIGSYKTSYVATFGECDVPSYSDFLKVSHQLIHQCLQADVGLGCSAIWCTQEMEIDISLDRYQR